MTRLGCVELSINKLFIYAVLFCLLCIGIMPVCASDTDTTLTKLYTQSSEYMNSPSEHALTRISPSATPPAGTITVVIGGNTYYYTPLSTENTSLLKLLSSYGNSALTVTTDASKAVYSYDGVYYTYDSDKFMKSVYSLSEVASSDSDTISKRVYNTSTGEYETKYYKISLNPAELNSNNVTYSNSSAGSDGYVGVGVSDSSTKNVYYKYDKPVGASTISVGKVEEMSNKPDGYVSTASGGYLHNGEGETTSVENKVFEGCYTKVTNTYTLAQLNNRYLYAFGGVIYNEGNMSNIVADFIGNYVEAFHENAQTRSSVSAYGGAIGNYGTIGKISGDFINNYTYGQSFYLAGGGAIDNENKTGSTSVISEIAGNFIGNYAYSETQSPYGGAIYNHAYSGTAKIGEIKANFLGNYVYGSNVYGGAIAQKTMPSATSEIGNISGDFMGNYGVTNGNYAQGGAIYNKADYANTTSKMGDIVGDFVGNYVNSQANAQGGAIYNMGVNGQATTKNIIGDFIGNYAFVSTFANTAITVQGGAIFNSKNDRGRASVGTITGEFLNNRAYAYSVSSALAEGGAIYNSATVGNASVGIYNSSFFGNYAMATSRGSTSTAHGGAIYTGTNLTIVADDGYVSTFDGNYVQTSDGSYNYKDNEAIYVGSEYATLTLKSQNGGKFVINDKINGTNGYSLVFVGDENGLAEVNNTIGGTPYLTVDTSTVTYDRSRNDTFDETHFSTVNVVNNGVFKTKIDMDIQNRMSDTFVVFEDDSSGFITIDDINMLSITSLSSSEPFVLQVLLSPTDNLQLALSDAQSGREYYMGEIGPSTEYDTVKAVTKWADVYYQHNYSAASLYAITNLATTNTTNDSIGITVIREGGTVENIPLGDTLVLVNQSNLPERTFTTDDASAQYNLTNDLGASSQGKLTVSGAKENGNISTLNLNNKQGFVLSNSTELTFKDVKVTGSDTLVDVANTNAVVNVNGAEIDGNIDADVEYNLNISGDSKFGGSVSTANATMTDGTLSMAENTFENANLDVRDGTVNLANDAVETYKISTLASSENVNYVIDFDADAQTSDVIQTTNESTGKVTVDHINLINGSSFSDIPADMTGQTYVVQVLKTQSDSLQLVLSENAQQELGNDKYKIGTTVHNLTDDVLAVTPWEQDFYKAYTQDEIFYGTLGLATTDTANDSIGITFTAPTEWGEKQLVGSLGDTLKQVNQSDLAERSFVTDDYTKNYKVKEDLGETKSGVVNVTGKAETVVIPPDPDDPSSKERTEVVRSTVDFDGHKGFELVNDNTTLNFKDVKLMGATAVATSDNESSTINFDNVVMVDNTYGVETAGNVNVSGASEISSPITLTSGNSTLKVDGTDNVTVNNALSGVDGSKLVMENGNIDFKENARVNSLNTTLRNTNLTLAKEDALQGTNLTVDGTAGMNIANREVGTLALGTLTLNGNMNLAVDADLAAGTMDRLTVASVAPDPTGKINVNKVNLLSSTTAKSVTIPFADENVAGYVQYTGQNKISYSKIYKYLTTYNNEDGCFTFARGSSHNPKSYNPSVFVGQVSQLTGQYGALTETFNIAFEHSDLYMNLPRDRRKAEEQKNRYAFDSVPTAGMYSPIMTRATDRGYWLKPYAVFESVPLKNGPKVSNINYGTLFGYDTPIERIRHGYDRVFTYYIGYNGSSQSFDHNDIIQNGGLIGMTTTLYKGNFFNATTLTAGASIANASTKRGSEDFVSMVAGIGNKIGYNWEFKQGKFIIQPYLFLGYAFVDTFDYKNASGVKIKTAPMNDIQIAPGIKFIGNTKRGWQPYIGVQFVCNVFIQSESTADNVRLPEMYINPYIQYGFGVQKIIQDRFTFFSQAMVRNGGRNGVSVTAGLRWILGR